MQGIGPDLVAAMRRLPGLRADRAGADRASGWIASVSFWGTAEHAQFPRAALGGIVRCLEAAGVQLEPSEIYEETAPPDRRRRSPHLGSIKTPYSRAVRG